MFSIFKKKSDYKKSCCKIVIEDVRQDSSTQEDNDKSEKENSKG